MTSLTDRAIDDTYKDLLQVSNSNAGIDTTRRAIEDGEGTASILKLSTVSYGADGRVYVDLDSGSADLAATLEALDTTAINHLVIDKPGTYVTGPWVINNLRALTIGPGVTIRYKASQSSDTSMIDVQRADFTLHLLGTLDGNRSNQGVASNQRCFHSYQYDRVRVLGYGKSGLVTGSTGNGIWLRDGDDLLISEMRGTDCGYQPLVIEATTIAIYRPRIERSFVDRSLEASTANDTGCIKITASSADGQIHDPVIEDCDAIHCDGGTNVAIELWSNDSGAVIGGGIINCSSYGPAAGIGQSVAKAVGSVLKPRRATNAVLCLELADCNQCSIEGGVADCNSVAASTGATIDNTNVTGYGNAIRGVSIKNAAATGISLAGTSYNSVISGNRINMSAGGAELEAILNDGGVDAVISGNTILVSGALTRGIVNDVAGVTIEGNTITINTGTGINHLNASHTVIRGNKIKATGTGSAAYALTDCQYCECTGGTIEGTFTNGCNLVSAAGTLDHNVVGGWTGVGGSASINTVSSGGTWGTNNRSIPIEGWAPGNGLNAWFSQLAASYTNWVWGGGVLVGAVPTAGPLFGGNGSMIQVVGDGTANNNVPWVLKNGTWTAIV